MIVHIPVLLRYLASGYSLDAALGISAITHRTERSIFRRTFAETFGVKCYKFPASLLVHTWAQPGQLPVPPTIPPASLRLPDPSLSCFLLDIPQQFHSHSAPPQAPSQDVSGVFPSSPHSLTPSLSSPTSRLSLLHFAPFPFLPPQASLTKYSSKINLCTNCMVCLSLLVEVEAEVGGPAYCIMGTGETPSSLVSLIHPYAQKCEYLEGGTIKAKRAVCILVSTVRSTAV